MFELTTAQKAFFELIKISIGTSNNEFDFSCLTDEDWNRVFAESQNQASALICFDALKNVKANLPKAIYNEWFLMAVANIEKNIRLIKEQEQLTNLLDNNCIPYVILKGLSSARYYPDSKNRCLGDIDFLVDKEQVDRTKQLLLDNNYVLLDDTSSIDCQFSHNRVYVELHKTISGIPNNKYGDYFAAAISDIIKESVLEDGFSRPSNYHHAIVLFTHTLHHLLSSGVGVRHLCDWACFVQQTHKEPFWNEKIIPLLKKTGTFNFMCGLTLVSVQLLGIDRPFWCKDVSEEMVETIIDEMVSSGNFGRKKSDQPSLMMTRKDSENNSFFSKISLMISALNKTNQIVCPLITKVPIIYPFLMMYRIFRYLLLMCLGKKPLLTETSRYADERNAVFKNYQLYKVEDDK